MPPPLAVETSGHGPTLVLLHGFTQNRHCWSPFDRALEADFRVVRVDAPGHGDSSDVVADIPASAALVGASAGQGHYLGYSMGGRTALRLAVDQPELVDRLVLIGATAGIRDREARRARVDDDDARARRLEAVGVDRFIDEWLAQPLFDGLPDATTHRDERRRNRVDALAGSLRHAGTGAQQPVWDRLSELAMPVLLVTGERDRKFTDIAEQMAGAIGDNARVHVMRDAGHAVHLEHPVATAELVRGWLEAS